MPGVPLVDLTILILLGAALLFSIVELGLSAWAVSVTDDTYNYGYYTYRSETPGEFAFLLFSSLWTLLGVSIFLTLDFLGGRRGGVSKPYPWLGWATLAFNFVTWVFWLAGFAALAAFYVFPPRGIAGALLAFAIMLWLVFTALFILNALTAFTVTRSDRSGYKPMFSRDGRVSRSSEGPAMTSA